MRLRCYALGLFHTTFMLLMSKFWNWQKYLQKLFRCFSCSLIQDYQISFLSAYNIHANGVKHIYLIIQKMSFFIFPIFHHLGIQYLQNSEHSSGVLHYPQMFMRNFLEILLLQDRQNIRTNIQQMNHLT